MAEWTPEALEAERLRREDTELNGICPDSGYTIKRCWETDLCDCAYSDPERCPVCGASVWDLSLHMERRHPNKPYPGKLTATNKENQ